MDHIAGCWLIYINIKKVCYRIERVCSLLHASHYKKKYFKEIYFEFVLHGFIFILSLICLAEDNKFSDF